VGSHDLVTMLKKWWYILFLKQLLQINIFNIIVLYLFIKLSNNLSLQKSHFQECPSSLS